VGIVRKDGRGVRIEIEKEFRDALLGLDGFSHILVLYWFHENDTHELRRTLRVHPRKNASNPLMGVFGTHSPARPNLIGVTRCRMAGISDGTIRIDEIDAFDGSPVIDIKCYIPDAEPPTGVVVPDWV
jgi:tRNA-Thr(GGU) m(6)t(6)A37 methyltransferase TsaA